MNMISEFSLLYPDKNKIQLCSYAGIEKVYEDLELNKLIAPNISELYTTDGDVLKYRFDLFSDVINISNLSPILKQIEVQLDNFSSFIREKPITQDNRETELNHLIELNYYTSTLNFLYEKLSNVADNFKSDALNDLFSCISNEINSLEFINLKKELSKFSDELLNIKSITVGINLDTQLRPKESGIISVNSKSYKSGNLLDRFLRLDFKDDGYQCIAPLTQLTADTTYEDRLKIEGTIDNALDKLLSKTIAKCKFPIRDYLIDKMSGYLIFLNELHVVCKVSIFIAQLQQKGMDVCIPTINTLSCCKINGLYNPLLCKNKIKDEIISNEIIFDNDKRIYVLTGPNNGGKSVFTVSVAIAQALFQIGIPLPAKNADMLISNSILLHFISKKEDIKEGRLEDECKRLAEILNIIDESSFLFMDETLSSTGAEEAAELGIEYLKKLSDIKCNCIFTTHLHNMAAVATDIPLVGTLSAQMTDHRTYKIINKPPDGTSYAKDIAEKYWYNKT